MKKCYFTYQDFSGEGDYSPAGLHFLHPKLDNLQRFPYDLKEQMQEVQGYAGKISIQGVQPKLSAKLSLKDEAFQLTDVGGTFILKPQASGYEQLPENEDLTMHLAKLYQISVPWHGLLLAKDGSLVYAVKRFDRVGRGKKMLQEDFAQLINATRTTKYQANMERVAKVVEDFCTFPVLEHPKLFKLLIFSFLVGNEDLHLKNFSLQVSPTGTVKLSPAYDLVNTTIALARPQEELALSLNDKKKGLLRSDFVDYFAVHYLNIPRKKADKMVDDLLRLVPEFNTFISRSFLNDEMKMKYLKVIEERAKRLS